LIVFLAAAASAQTEPQKTAEAGSNSSLVAQAEALLRGGKIDAAIETLKSMPTSSSADTTINYLLGVAYYQKSDYVRAIEHLLIGVKQAPNDSPQYRQGMQMLGLSQYLLGHIKEALPYLEEVAGWSTSNVEISYVLGLSYIQTQNPNKARETFARMFNIEPSSPAAHLLNAQMMIRQRFENVAEKELQKALELDPKLPQANFLLGELAIFNANLDRGIGLLQKEIEINPAFSMAYYRLGEAYTRQLKWDEAVAPLQKSIWLNPYFSGPYIVLGKVHLKKGDLSNAETVLRRALMMDQNNFSGHHLLAQVLQRANRLEEAKKEFELADRLRTSSDNER
jgi:tetratricopeptide (TPR) repeat protein